MKRLFPFIPIAFLFLFNSCGQLPISEPVMQTAVVQTLTAIAMPSMPTSTTNPYTDIMIRRLNDDLSTVNPLERTLDAEYSVLDFEFVYISNSSKMTFRIDVGCICMNSDKCCIPERTFIVITESIKRNLSWLHVPENVGEMLVVCRHQQSREPIGAVVAPWQDVFDYLWNNGDSGYQLGVHAIRTVAP